MHEPTNEHTGTSPLRVRATFAPAELPLLIINSSKVRIGILKAFCSPEVLEMFAASRVINCIRFVHILQKLYYIRSCYHLRSMKLSMLDTHKQHNDT